jgi:hypothetical protein
MHLEILRYAQDDKLVNTPQQWRAQGMWLRDFTLGNPLTIYHRDKAVRPTHP